MRSAIYGAGSLGTILGAFIARTGTPIDLINRNQAHIAALKEKGAQVVGTMNFVLSNCIFQLILWSFDT